MNNPLLTTSMRAALDDIEKVHKSQHCENHIVIRILHTALEQITELSEDDKGNSFRLAVRIAQDALEKTEGLGS